MTGQVANSADVYGPAPLEHGVAEATRDGEPLVVVNVTRGDAYVDTRYAGSSETAELEARLEALPLKAELRQSMSGDVAEEILGVAEETHPRVIVVGVRRRTPLGKLVMGSVAQRLILDAECPVLAVKPSVVE